MVSLQGYKLENFKPFIFPVLSSCHLGAIVKKRPFFVLISNKNIPDINNRHFSTFFYKTQTLLFMLASYKNLQ